MNFDMLRRAIDRHRYMHERVPYTRFIESVARRPEVWRATQHEVASWWIKREAARIELERLDATTLRVTTALNRGAVTRDGEPIPRAFECECPAEFDPESLRIAAPDRVVPFVSSLLRHLGCSHVAVQRAGTSLPDTLVDQIESYTAHTLDARSYPEELVAGFTQYVEDLHRSRGVPFLRLWPLPKNDDDIPYRAAFSPRFDVDKAIVNVPLISELHQRHGIRGTFYLRVTDMFYGAREIRDLGERITGGDELALHGEFVTTAERGAGDEASAAVAEKSRLETLLGRPISGLCTHGGELRANQTPSTPGATDHAGFTYETTFYRRPYYHPMFLPGPEGSRSTLTILRHDDDVSLPIGPGFSNLFVDAFTKSLDEATAVGGVFVPTMHPLYFDLQHYLSYPRNLYRLAAVVPVFLSRAARLKRGQLWENQDAMSNRSHSTSGNATSNSRR